jgi:hypothetical protein
VTPAGKGPRRPGETRDQLIPEKARRSRRERPVGRSRAYDLPVHHARAMADGHVYVPAYPFDSPLVYLDRSSQLNCMLTKRERIHVIRHVLCYCTGYSFIIVSNKTA